MEATALPGSFRVVLQPARAREVLRQRGRSAAADGDGRRRRGRGHVFPGRPPWSTARIHPGPLAGPGGRVGFDEALARRLGIRDGPVSRASCDARFVRGTTLATRVAGVPASELSAGPITRGGRDAGVPSPGPPRWGTHGDADRSCFGADQSMPPAMGCGTDSRWALLGRITTACTAARHPAVRLLAASWDRSRFAQHWTALRVEASTGGLSAIRRRPVVVGQTRTRCGAVAALGWQNGTRRNSLAGIVHSTATHFRGGWRRIPGSRTAPAAVVHGAFSPPIRHGLGLESFRKGLPAAALGAPRGPPCHRPAFIDKWAEAGRSGVQGQPRRPFAVDCSGMGIPGGATPPPVAARTVFRNEALVAWGSDGTGRLGLGRAAKRAAVNMDANRSSRIPGARGTSRCSARPRSSRERSCRLGRGRGVIERKA